MTAISPTLSVPPERSVDPALLDALRFIDSGMRALTRSYFVGGAMARDLILWNAHGVGIDRLTRDIDLGVLIEEWDTFEQSKHTSRIRAAVIRTRRSGTGFSFGLPATLLR